MTELSDKQMTKLTVKVNTECKHSVHGLTSIDKANTIYVQTWRSPEGLGGYQCSHFNNLVCEKGTNLISLNMSSSVRKSVIYRRKSSFYGIDIEVSDHSDRKPSLLVYLAAFSALMGAICKGCVFGWSAPALDDLSRPDSVPQITDEDSNVKAWIGSIITLGALAGGLISGRRKALIFYGIPFTLGWILLIVAKSVSLIIVGRVVTGFCCGLVSGAYPDSWGINTFIFGSFLHWNHLAIVGMSAAITMTVLMVLMPESPVWLINRYQDSDLVMQSLIRLRQRDSDLLIELKELEKSVDTNPTNSYTNQTNSALSRWISQLKRPELYKPFIISLAVMFFQQASGISAVEFFTTEIFIEAGSSLRPSVATIIVGAAMVGATLVGSLLTDRLGRKILLIVSGVGYVVSAGLMGLYYYQYSPHTYTDVSNFTFNSAATMVAPVAEEHIVSTVGWLPIFSIILYVVAFSIGFGPIGWMLFPEITPSYAIGYVSSAVQSVHWLTAFACSYNFDIMEQTLTRFGTFWMFAAISVFSVVFVVLFVPETKGLSKDEITSMFAVNRRLEMKSTLFVVKSLVVVLMSVHNLDQILCQSFFIAGNPRPLYTPEVHTGYYDIWYPGYQHDNPKPWHYRGAVPFGLPLGGYAANGQPFGLTSYLVGRSRRDNHGWERVLRTRPSESWGRPRSSPDI
ncbi:unnamed protein product [Oppiella nova]|uniref:Major facilitator superfamily (MFS) profile domain-containing protein n=1 Tax=Oppiella nova TaxID=334625 RepID=A0A7R9QIS1_9ACAR|nr:unnamed protein product [Oppiella nova]CAG2166676.1 unnamed protein product [Oppiella nova]